MINLRLYILISHQTGATFWIPLDQIIELIPVIKTSAIVHTTREMTPTFRDWNIFLGVDASNSKHEKTFAIGTSGNVGSIWKRNGKGKKHIHSRNTFYILPVRALSIHWAWFLWRAAYYSDPSSDSFVSQLVPLQTPKCERDERTGGLSRMLYSNIWWSGWLAQN